MNLMVAADDNWAIGNKNELLITIPENHRIIRQETEGKVVVYGRKTLSTFPQKMPLPGRVNVILSSSRDFQVKGAKVAHDLEELFEELRKYPREQIYVIGGESVYRQLLPYCRVAHVTKIHCRYQADAFFPDLDAQPGWRLAADSEEQTYFDVTYHFLKYEKKDAIDFSVKRDNNKTHK